MKYRIGAAFMGPLVIAIPISLYETDADVAVDKPITTLPLIIRDSDTFESAARRLLDHMFDIETLLEHNKQSQLERAVRFEQIKLHTAMYKDVVITSKELKKALLGQDE